MGLAEGGDLFEQLGRGNTMLDNATIWKLFDQIVKAMTYTHSRRIIHRDIKPENIFLDKEGNVMIGDWGYASTWSSWKRKKKTVWFT